MTTGVKNRMGHHQNGVLVGYQTVRDNAAVIGLARSNGASYADSWRSVQFQRMPNVSLMPAAGNQKISADDLIADVKDGIYIEGDGSFSIDQQRYNFQFGGQVFWEIKKVKDGILLMSLINRAAGFWAGLRSPVERVLRLGGSYFDARLASQIKPSRTLPSRAFRNITHNKGENLRWLSLGQRSGNL